MNFMIKRVSEDRNPINMLKEKASIRFKNIVIDG